MTAHPSGATVGAASAVRSAPLWPAAVAQPPGQGMSRLITVLADMTSQRDRNALEITVVEVMFRLIGARRINLWRVIEHRAGERVSLLAGIGEGQGVTMSDPGLDAGDSPRLSDMPELAACHAAREPLSLTAADGALHRHFFPVQAQADSLSILAVEVERSLSAYDLQLIDGFLRIYRNHLELLDYGEHDTLTGLFNRKPFAQIFAQRTAAPTRVADAPRKVQFIGDARKLVPGASEWLAIIDIDHFKRINDSFGHVFGDEVLLLLARLMKVSFRSCDTLFRFGGEEFAVLISGTDEIGARTAFEHFRERVEAYDFPQVDGVTVSIGYSRATHVAGAMAAYEQADAALYYAKEHGRNCTCNFESLIAQGALRSKRASGDIELF